MRLVEAAGVPRDLGRELGGALRAELRAAVGADRRWTFLARLRRADPLSRLARDLRRHFPHQSEWLEGLALGAGVPLRGLLRALAAGSGPSAPRGAALAVRSGGAVRVAAIPPRGAVLLRVAPEGRLRSIEVGSPASPAPALGVNEAGLAIAVVAYGSRPARHAAPTALFARDCLERFDRVDPALDWCLARPAANGGALVLADAHGEIAGVDADGPARRVLRPADAVLSVGATVDAARLAKRERLAAPDELESALALALAAALPSAEPVAIVDPIGRRLRPAGGEWIEVAR